MVQKWLGTPFVPFPVQALSTLAVTQFHPPPPQKKKKKTLNKLVSDYLAIVLGQLVWSSNLSLSLELISWVHHVSIVLKSQVSQYRRVLTKAIEASHAFVVLQH